MLHRGSGLHCVARFHVGHAPGVTRVGFAHRDLAGVGHGGTQELGLPVQRYLLTKRLRSIRELLLNITSGGIHNPYRPTGKITVSKANTCYTGGVAFTVSPAFM